MLVKSISTAKQIKLMGIPVITVRVGLAVLYKFTKILVTTSLASVTQGSCSEANEFWP